MTTPNLAQALVIPDSLLAKEATDILREHSTDLLFSHSIRVYLFAAEQGRQRNLRFDRELLYVAAAFHDLGLIKKFSSPDERFVRLRAAGHLGEGPLISLDTRLLLLDVLRRAASWDAAAALIAELMAEELEHPFTDIVAFHRRRIEARDSGRYTIAQALARESKPDRGEADPDLLKAIARHLKIVRKGGTL
ncbi:HD domain-containing protein [Bradyrhizobium sp. STM 3561]|uniref:HD domain-containing protein n=1 Tax=Bradyrhizobium sp. STM 3561 TaxID=578923 RepID=UPI00388F9580